MRMIICPKTAEFIIFEAPSKVILSISVCFSSLMAPSNAAFTDVIRKAINSTMITAPSIIIPKSSAPRLIRLASIPKIYIIESVKNKASGIIEAMTSADRTFPSKRMTINTTMRHPKTRFSTTVNDVFEISSLRSRIGLMKTPSGRFFWMVATRFFTSLITSFEFAFLSIITWPRTFSPCPFAVIAPNRFA